MVFKKFSIFIFLLITSGTAFSMEITKGKKYKNKKTGNFIFIEKTCKEAWGIEGLAKAGKLLHIPAILNYLMVCLQESEKMKLTEAALLKILDGDQAPIKACVDPKYFGSFYYGREGISGTCVHESWLSPAEEDHN